MLLLELGISIHVPRAGYDAATTSFVVRTGAFLSTYPVRGTTIEGRRMPLEPDISIHVPRAGYDFGPMSIISITGYFYPRTPCGVRRIELPRHAKAKEFLSTYPVRGTTIYDAIFNVRNGISIHVPRAGYDLCADDTGGRFMTFLSTYPVRGTTSSLSTMRIALNIFLSTYPVRGTTFLRRTFQLII